jgi:hypothetical protein
MEFYLKDGITQKLNLDNTNKRLIRLYSLLKTIINEGLK